MPATLLATAAKSAAASQPRTRRAIDTLPTIRTNVGNAERALSFAVGGALSAFGFDGRGPSLLSVLTGGYLLYRAATGNCPGYQMIGVTTAGPSSPNAVIPAGQGTRVDHTITVKKPASEVYRCWRDFENLPRFMTHLEAVEVTDNHRSHWVAKGPFGLRVEWNAEIVTDEPGRSIAWKSLDGSDVDTAGSIHFRDLPQEQGTEVYVQLKYDPPAGKLGTAIAKLFGKAPEQEIAADLLRFKHLVEAGEMPSQRMHPSPS